MVCQLIVLPWQIVGVLRAGDRHLAELRSIVWIWGVQFGIAASVILTLISVYSGFQSLFADREAMRDAAARAQHPQVVPYTLTPAGDDRLIHLTGDFEFGITRDLEALLRQHRDATGIVLNSDGGQIYEGRGVARLITLHGLNTHVFDTCKSACVTAFVAGATRTLGPDGKLGFHQYRLDAGFANPLVDVAAEQERDRRFYAGRHIDPGFLRKVFDRPPDEIWFPPRDELLAAGVIHRTAGAASSAE